MPRQRPRGGRPSKFTAARLAVLFHAIADGMPRWEAALIAGIGKSTLMRWLAAGRAGDPRYAPLAQAIETAELIPRAVAKLQELTEARDAMALKLMFRRGR